MIQWREVESQQSFRYCYIPVAYINLSTSLLGLRAGPKGTRYKQATCIQEMLHTCATAIWKRDLSLPGCVFLGQWYLCVLTWAMWLGLFSHRSGVLHLPSCAYVLHIEPCVLPFPFHYAFWQELLFYLSFTWPNCTGFNPQSVTLGKVTLCVIEQGASFTTCTFTLSRLIDVIIFPFLF